MSALPDRLAAPGVGCVFPGIAGGLAGPEAALLAERGRHLRPILARASELAGCDLASAIERGAIESLPPLAAQLLTCAFSLGLFASLEDQGLAEPCAVAGHSMGIYAALAAAGAVGEDDALRLIVEAHRLSREACAGQPCGMVAIIGLEKREVGELIGSRPQVCLAIRNGEISHVVSGPQVELNQVVAAAEAAGATRALFIEREAPYHHPGILTDAAKAFLDWLGSLSWSRARCPLISTIDARALREPGELQEFTAQNLCSPIDWEKTVLALAQCGATTLLECGAGNGLSKLGRFIDAPVEYVGLKHLAREPAA